MRKRVINIDYVGACRYTGYINKSVILSLECGHTKMQKASQKIPKKANCSECDESALKEKV